MRDVTSEQIFENIAASPEDPLVWQVLADYLLETGDEGAALARVQLELFKGLSNPELIGELAQAMATRRRFAFEAYEGNSFISQCGFLVRLELSARLSPALMSDVLASRQARTLHHLRFVDDSATYTHRTFGDDGRLLPTSAPPPVRRLRGALEVVTPYLRRCSVDYGARAAPLTMVEHAEVLSALIERLPASVERVDLALTKQPDLAALIRLARRVKVLNLDGTRLFEASQLLDAAPDTDIILGGTGLSPAQVEHPRAKWLADDAVAWLEHETTGVVSPLTPSKAHPGYDAPSLGTLAAPLSLQFGGEWKLGRHAVSDGATVGEYVLRLR